MRQGLASSKFVHVKREEAVLDAREASIVAEQACLDDFDDEDAAGANAAAQRPCRCSRPLQEEAEEEEGPRAAQSGYVAG